MLDIRLPYFYNLAVAVLLTLFVVNKLEGVFSAAFLWNQDFTVGYPIPMAQNWLGIKLLLVSLPALTAAAYYVRQFYLRNDLYVRETIYILSVVNVLSYLIQVFLP